MVRFYVGEITGTTPQTVKIYTDNTNHEDVTVSEGNKWYTYVLPKDKGLCKIEGDSVKKVVIKANISYEPKHNPPYYYDIIIPSSTVEASFKGSNTSKVTNMLGMFHSCSGLTSLDLSNFNTSNVTNMREMFYGCEGLTSLNLSNFNTSNVTKMGSMFNLCSGLISLDVSNFNTSNVTDMGEMFRYCSSLTSLDLSGWDISNVTYMMEMFLGCSGLISLDLSSWVISNVTNMDNMFEHCTALKTIRMVGCSEGTINKIRGIKPSTARIVTE